jgi:hypothetical protein
MYGGASDKRCRVLATIHFCWGKVSQSLLWSLVIVVDEVAIESVPGVLDGLIGVEVYLLPLHRAPQALDKHVVERPTTPIHADAYSPLIPPIGELGAGKLSALVGIEDVRSCTRQCAVQGFDTERPVRLEPQIHLGRAEHRAAAGDPHKTLQEATGRWRNGGCHARRR